MDLKSHLRRRIAVEGPITVADYMAEALGHPAFGYYRTRDPLGKSGDFTTAPEISQMFGELIGLWCAEVWRQMGAPGEVALVELGPGRGTLSADILRAGKMMPGFSSALSLHLVETSPVLRKAQGDRLSAFMPTWHDDVTSLPDGCPLIVIANEFFDALPIHQLIKTEKGWCERLVGLRDDELSFGLALGPGPTSALVDESLLAAPEGKLVELAPIAWRIMGDISKRLVQQGGAALVIDYGYAGPATGDTLQAVKAHQPCDVLETPGEADLTAHVDFTALAQAARQAGSRMSSLSHQGQFLQALGIEMRVQALAKTAQDKGLDPERFGRDRDRLIGPDAMGTLFKVLGIANPHQPPLPALEG